ncbi:MAG: branched-chain amino acid ABC transporter permease [Pseudomonadota bacterium]
MTLTAFALGVISGLALASIYILVALGFTLVIAASGVFNFAQGSVVMIGTILAYLFTDRLGWPAGPALLVSLGIGALLGLLTHLVAVRPAMGRSHDLGHATLLTTIGLGTALNAAVALWFGGESFNVKSYVGDTPVQLLGVPIRPVYLLIIGAAAAITLTIELVARRTAIHKPSR